MNRARTATHTHTRKHRHYQTIKRKSCSHILSPMLCYGIALASRLRTKTWHLLLSDVILSQYNGFLPSYHIFVFINDKRILATAQIQWATERRKQKHTSNHPTIHTTRQQHTYTQQMNNQTYACISMNAKEEEKKPCTLFSLGSHNYWRWLGNFLVRCTDANNTSAPAKVN